LEAARRNLREYKRPSKAKDRFYELTGALARCSECGRALVARPVTYKLKRGGTSTIHYYRCSKAYGYHGRCEHTTVYRAEVLEGRVWDLVASLLRDPDRLRTALDRLIEEERRSHHGDPEREARVWLKKVAEVDAKRARFQDMAAEGLISFEELRAKLENLEGTRETARRELDALAERRERLAELEGDRNALLTDYSVRTSKGLDLLTSEDRHHGYKKLGLTVLVRPGGDLEVEGVLRNTLGKALGLLRTNGTSTGCRRPRTCRISP